METWKHTEIVSGCQPHYITSQSSFSREISCPVADKIAWGKQGLYGTNLVLCNQHLLHNDTLMQKTCLLPVEFVRFKQAGSGLCSVISSKPVNERSSERLLCMK